MFVLSFIKSEISWSNAGLIVILSVILISLLQGKINLKLSFLLTSLLLGGLFAFQFMQSKKVLREVNPLTLVDTNSLENITPSVIPKETKKSIPESYEETTEPLSKYLATISIKGIEDKKIIQGLEKKSRYTIVKNGDYLIEFLSSGSIKEGDIKTGNRFAHSGGHLIIKVGGERCYFSRKNIIPIDLPLGNGLPQANQTIQKKLDEYAAKNMMRIISALEECLPKY